MKKNVYIRCPRCELNYILKKDKFCNVCKTEMGASREKYEELELELCPVCHINFLNADEQICATCKEEGNLEFEDDEEEKEWRRYIGEEEDVETEEETLTEGTSVIDIDDDGHLDFDDEFEPIVDDVSDFDLGDDIIDEDLEKDFVDDDIVEPDDEDDEDEEDDDDDEDYDDYDDIDFDDDDEEDDKPKKRRKK